MSDTRIDKLMDCLQKWIVVLPIVSFVLYVLSLTQYGDHVVSWVALGWEILVALVGIYVWWRLSSDARKHSLSSAKYLTWYLYLSILDMMLSIVSVFVSEDDVFGMVEVPSSWLSIIAIILLAFACVAFAILALVLVFGIPSRLKQDGFLPLRKLFIEYIVVSIVAGIIIVVFSGTGTVDLTDLELFVEAYYVYRFFCRRNDLALSK